MLSVQSYSAAQPELRANLTATVIGLHEITETPKAGDRTHVTPAQLSDFIRRKTAQGFEFVDLDGAFENGRGNGRNLLLTFDGGYIGNYRHSSLLRFMRVPAVFFIDPWTIGQSDGAYPMMLWDHVRALSNQPSFEIGLHSNPQRAGARLAEGFTPWQEFTSLKQAIARNTGISPRAVASPVADNGRAIEAERMSLFECGFCFGSAPRDQHTRGALPRRMLYQGNIDRL